MNFTFEHPTAFLFLILFFVCFKFCKPRLKSLFFPNLNLLKKVSSKKGTLLNLTKFLTVLFLTVALASPVVKDEIVLQNQKGYEISLILDASGSMAEGGKFQIVKRIVEDFIDKRKNDKIGLTIFADFAYVAVPLTYDKESLKRLLNRIDVGIAGTHRTALYEALFMSTKLFKNSEAKEKIAILLTDGMDNTNSIPLEVAVNTAKKYRIKVYTIGVGGRGDYNPFVLQKIAQETGGKFFEARSGTQLKRIYQEIDKLEKSDIKAEKYFKKRYFFQYFLALAALFLTIFILLYRK